MAPRAVHHLPCGYFGEAATPSTTSLSLLAAPCGHGGAFGLGSTPPEVSDGDFCTTTSHKDLKSPLGLQPPSLPTAQPRTAHTLRLCFPQKSTHVKPEPSSLQSFREETSFPARMERTGVPAGTSGLNPSPRRR